MTVAPKQRSFTASRSIEKQEPDVVGRWRGRPVLAMLVRFAAVLFPIIIATVAAFGVSRLFPPATTLGAVLAQWVAVIAVATLTVRITRPVAKRFLPLGALLELTLVFPDEAPSRIQTAMKHTSEEELRELIAHTRKHGLPSDSSKAAGIILTLVAELNRHDRLTRGHAERVRVYTGLIAEEMGLSRDEVGRLQWAGLLHDIGKLAVSADILNKPGELTDDEYDEIKSHTTTGAIMVEPLRGWLGDAIDAVSQHHERWDGRGYPYRLTGEEITLAARIIAVADVFDVITAKRSYKEALPPEFARKEIARCAGTQFDPAVVRAFLSISLGRLKWAGGPIAWLAQLPVLASIPMIPATMPSLGAAAAATAVTAASLTAVPASTVQDFKLSIQGPPAAEASEDSYLDGAEDGADEAGAVEVATPAPRPTTNTPRRNATPAAPVPTTSSAPTAEEAPPATPPDDELQNGEGDEADEIVATVLPEDLEDEPVVAPTVAEPTTELTTETPTTDPAPTSVPDPSVEEELAELDQQIAEQLVDNPDQADEILAEAEEQRADILASAEEQGEVAPLGGPTKGRSSRTSQGQGNAPEKPLG